MDGDLTVVPCSHWDQIGWQKFFADVVLINTLINTVNFCSLDCEIQHLKIIFWIRGRRTGYPRGLGPVCLSDVPLLPEAGPVLEKLCS